MRIDPGRINPLSKLDLQTRLVLGFLIATCLTGFVATLVGVWTINKSTIDEVQNRIDELYQAIGRRVVNLALGEALPKASDRLLQDEEIAAAMADLKDRKQELEDLNHEIKNEKDLFKTAAKGTEVKTP